MAGHQQPSPTAGMPPPPHGPHPPLALANGPPPAQAQAQPKTPLQFLAASTEGLWSHLGSLAEAMHDVESAQHSYEQALKFNPWSLAALQGTASVLRSQDKFTLAADYLRTVTKIDPNNGDAWGHLGHCYLMMDELHQAWQAYQQALLVLSDPKEPKLWYGIGILYDRYGSLDHAEEAFSQVMRMAPMFDKANEIYFRLGIIYKQQGKFDQSLECFKYILHNPPRPLTEEDIWFQIGHVYEQQKQIDAAKDAYRRVLERDANHAKVLQQLGWLHHQQSTNYNSQEQAIEYLEKSVNSDNGDAQSWYLLGRCYMSQQKYPKAYEAYQQAVYRDGKNPTFWCSIGVLYYQINQYRDALDAYSRAIRLNPNISEVWYDLGTLYESCNNQTTDALDAYQRAAELDPQNVHIKARLQLLQNGHSSNGPPPSVPMPQDIPMVYQPASMHGPAAPQWGAPPNPPPPPPPGPTPPNHDWNRPLAAIRDMQMPGQQMAPAQPVAPYEARDGFRPPTQPGPRPGSPRPDAMRPYSEAPRPGPGGRRAMSPSPKTHHAAPMAHHAPPSLPPPPPALAPQGPPPGPVQLQQAPNRISNPNYGPHATTVPPPPPPSALGALGPGPGAGHGPPFRANSPPEMASAGDKRPATPGTAYGPPAPYGHHGNPGGPMMGGGAVQGYGEVRDERDGRPPTAPPPPKRHREWEDERGTKLPGSDEKRQKVDESHMRRPTPPQHTASPRVSRHSPHDGPRFNEGYHPSEAAHHVPALTAGSGPPSLARVGETSKQEHVDHGEPAARKMDVDENYSDGSEDKAGVVKSERNSPRMASGNGMSHAPTPAEQKA